MSPTPLAFKRILSFLLLTAAAGGSATAAEVRTEQNGWTPKSGLYGFLEFGKATKVLDRKNICGDLSHARFLDLDRRRYAHDNGACKIVSTNRKAPAELDLDMMCSDYDRAKPHPDSLKVRRVNDNHVFIGDSTFRYCGRQPLIADGGWIPPGGVYAYLGSGIVKQGSEAADACSDPGMVLDLDLRTHGNDDMTCAIRSVRRIKPEELQLTMRCEIADEKPRIEVSTIKRIGKNRVFFESSTYVYCLPPSERNKPSLGQTLEK